MDKDWLRSFRSPSAARPAAPAAPSLAERLAAAARAPGALQGERLVRRCACAESGRPFLITFGRDEPGALFRIEKIERMAAAESEAGATARLQALIAQHKSPDRQFSIEELDFSAWRCAWCQDDHPILCTSCGDLVCAARCRPTAASATFFRCHEGCGATGPLAPLKSLDLGKAPDRRPAVLMQRTVRPALAVPAGKPLPLLSARPALPALPQPRPVLPALPPPRKR